MDTLQALGHLISSVCSPQLDPDYKLSIGSFKKEYAVLREIFGITIPNKVHFLQDHLEDYLDITGESLADVDDGVVEAMHQYLDKRMSLSNYWVKNLESEAHGKKKLRLVLHMFVCIQIDIPSKPTCR